MRVGVLMPLWTFRDGAKLLERAAGEIGVDHVVVPVVTGPLTSFRNPAVCDPPAFATEGGWHFPPESKRYATAGVRPHAARWIAQRDWLSQFCTAAGKLAIGVACRVEPAAAIAAMERAESLWLRDAWGEPFASRAGCLCNPVLRELTAAMCADVASRCAAMRIEVWRDLPFCVTLQSLAGAGLESVCFCAACRQLAAREGVDVEDAVRAAKTKQEASAEQPGAADRLMRESETPSSVTNLSRARSVDVDRWIRTLPNTAPADLPDVCDEMSSGNYAEIEMQPLVADAAGELVRRASAAAENGVETLVFTGLDTAPRAAVTWAKQAARYARRAST